VRTALKNGQRDGAVFCSTGMKANRPGNTCGCCGGGEMAINKVEICGVDTKALPVLKNERMRELFPKVHSGNIEARHEFIQGNLRLVLSVIQRFHNRGESVDDLFQVGCIGLIKAMDNFDTNQPVRFSTYAVPMIIGEIRRYLRDNNPIRVSRSLRDTAYKALKARDALAARLGRDPTIEQIAKEMDAREEDVVFALEAIQDPVSLHEPVYQDGGDAIYIMDQVRDDRVSENDWVRSLSIRQALEHLGERERSIITQRFFGGRTQMEVAEEIGISQAQVSRLEKAALQQMKKYI
jgi:RNA polymerase sporulation-specific sigma factor